MTAAGKRHLARLQAEAWHIRCHKRHVDAIGKLRTILVRWEWDVNEKEKERLLEGTVDAENGYSDVMRARWHATRLDPVASLAEVDVLKKLKRVGPLLLSSTQMVAATIAIGSLRWRCKRTRP